MATGSYVYVMTCRTDVKSGDPGVSVPTVRCVIDGVTGLATTQRYYMYDEPVTPATAGGTASNGLSGDVFVGAALVGMVAIGWIAGMQR